MDSVAELAEEREDQERMDDARLQATDRQIQQDRARQRTTQAPTLERFGPKQVKPGEADSGMGTIRGGGLEF